MKNEPWNPSEALSRVSGFHQYWLSEPVGLCYVSDHLCAMLGYTREELLAGDGYTRCLHPGDREAYGEFLERLGRAEQTETLTYRLIPKDGRTIFVRDTMTSYRLDGRMLADSVLTDITDLKNENQNLRFLNETIPCGFVKYTCERVPRVTYLNDRMRQILRFPETRGAGCDQLEICLQNIYTMIPLEERGRFARYLERVSEQGAPLAGEMALLRCDGTRAYVFGWVTKCVNDRGEEEF